jgi:hypothetical protein
MKRLLMIALVLVLVSMLWTRPLRTSSAASAAMLYFPIMAQYEIPFPPPRPTRTPFPPPRPTRTPTP